MTASPAVSLSPSFNSYSNTRLAEIAARVVGEFGSDDDELYDKEAGDSATQQADGEANSEYVERESRNIDRDDDDEEFEFAFATTRDSGLCSPISADEIFHNGQIRPVYPLFNRDLFLKYERNGKDSGVSEKAPTTIRLPLRKLFTEERESAMTTTSSSSSSSEADGVAAETYCVWRPKEEQRCKKSSSAGSNLKKWTFKDLLLNRSHSDGSKDSFVFLSSGRKKESGERVKSAVYGGEKRRTYLPYRQDLVGLFSNVNGWSKN